MNPYPRGSAVDDIGHLTATGAAGGDKTTANLLVFTLVQPGDKTTYFEMGQLDLLTHGQDSFALKPELTVGLLIFKMHSPLIYGHPN